LYPLKFFPVYKDYLWGGRNLEKLGKALPAGIIAESWEISAHPDGVCTIANGEMAGLSFPDYLKRFGRDAIGRLLPEHYAAQFPLLVKLLDANQQLSVQVHPDDEYAGTHGGGLGKNEMWYIIDAKPGASIIYGVRPGTTRESLGRAVREGRILDCLQQVRVAPGDVFDIPAGMVHGLGAGIVLAEIQQSSNLTYRIYDYDRIDAQGNKRPLHVEPALEVIDFQSAGREPKLQTAPVALGTVGTRARLVANDYFITELYEVNGTFPEQAEGERFFINIFIAGEGIIRYQGGVLPVKAAESVFIPATLGKYTVEGRLKFLKAYIGSD
jgi:mannose-6-phosphate isomerase